MSSDFSPGRPFPQPHLIDTKDIWSTSDPTSPHASSANGSVVSASSALSKKRKAPGSVTANACTSCKKARSKCDGEKPACSRCIKRRTPQGCLYEMHSKAAKDQMLDEIERLRMENHQLVQRNSTLDEKNELLEHVVQSLKHGKRSDEIIHRLKRGESHESIVDWLGQPLLRDMSTESERELNMAIDRYRQHWAQSQDPCYWTNVTNDGVLVEHLIALYLTWVHSAHMLFDEEQFISSFRDCQDTYCSPSLVNAMCAMGCHVLRSEWRGDVDVRGGIDHLQVMFIDEVEALRTKENASKMTSIQTCAVMFLVELARGHGLTAAAHLRFASESLTEKDAPNEQAVASADVSSWGILTLTTAWFALVYQKPNLPVSPYAQVFRDIPEDQFKDRHPARRHSSSDSDGSEGGDYSLTSAYELAKLYTLVHEITLAYCGARGKIAVERMISIYDRLLTWRRQLPQGLRDPVAEDEAAPHLLFLHIQYHVTVLQTLQPMLHLSDTTDSSTRTLVNLMLDHARTGFDFLLLYCETHTCYRQSPLQLFCTVHICDAVIKYSHASSSDDDRNSTTTSAVEFALRSLAEAQVGFPIAGILRALFCQGVLERQRQGKQHSLIFPASVQRQLDEPCPYSPYDIQNALTRSTYQQPMAQVLPMLDPSLARDFAEVLAKRERSGEGRRNGSDRPESMRNGRDGRPESMRIGSVLND